MKTLSRRAFLSAAAPLLASAQRQSSGRGARFAGLASVSPDPLTERLTYRLTPPGHLHHLPHYHHRFLSRSNSFALVAGERTGLRQIFRLNLPKADMVQLTSGPGVHPYSPTLDRREKNFYFLQGNELKRASAKRGRERRIYQTESGWRMTGHLAVSDQNRYATVVEMREEDWVTGFEQQFSQKPRCRIQLVDLRLGTARLLVGVNTWIAHPQFRPRSNDVLYCHEGPWDQVDARLWLMRPGSDGPRNLRPRKAAEQLGHEYWSGYGSEVCYVFYPDETGRRATVRCIDVNTGKERIVSRCTRFGWLSANRDNSVIVGASRSLAGPNIYLLFSRLQREITVCEHASTGKAYPLAGTDRDDPWASAPEPVFSPDSQLIYFVSDREGLPAVYRIGVPDLVEETRRLET
ncbi:MAG: oligogalacturonate lyase family protein [Bryobacterales bacterium]|nr:oligogalacturonate lyase family protein [Bryobacterales bacterium]MDE0293910.1 oligogalacturonate lyase family protein [Bryobacterales bacterium]